MAEGKRMAVIPLMLLGDGQVGKTSLTLALTKNKFDDSLLTTVGKESYMYQTNLHGHNVKDGYEWAETHHQLEDNLPSQTQWKYLDCEIHKRRCAFKKAL